MMDIVCIYSSFIDVWLFGLMPDKSLSAFPLLLKLFSLLLPYSDIGLLLIAVLLLAEEEFELCKVLPSQKFLLRYPRN